MSTSHLVSIAISSAEPQITALELHIICFTTLLKALVAQNCDPTHMWDVR